MNTSKSGEIYDGIGALFPFLDQLYVEKKSEKCCVTRKGGGVDDQMEGEDNLSWKIISPK